MTRATHQLFQTLIVRLFPAQTKILRAVLTKIIDARLDPVVELRALLAIMADAKRPPPTPQTAPQPSSDLWPGLLSKPSASSPSTEPETDLTHTTPCKPPSSSDEDDETSEGDHNDA